MKKIAGMLMGIVMVLTLKSQNSEIYAKDGIAINGYDAVAYFTEGKPVKGAEEFSIIWKNVKWLFSSKANADLFVATPEKYAPQYGGYCAFGCSRGYKAKTSPDAWAIDNGKLYLNYNTGVRETWNSDRQNYILKADGNWPKVKGTMYP